MIPRRHLSSRPQPSLPSHRHPSLLQLQYPSQPRHPQPRQKRTADGTLVATSEHYGASAGVLIRTAAAAANCEYEYRHGISELMCILGLLYLLRGHCCCFFFSFLQALHGVFVFLFWLYICQDRLYRCSGRMLEVGYATMRIYLGGMLVPAVTTEGSLFLFLQSFCTVCVIKQVRSMYASMGFYPGLLVTESAEILGCYDASALVLGNQPKSPKSPKSLKSRRAPSLLPIPK